MSKRKSTDFLVPLTVEGIPAFADITYHYESKGNHSSMAETPEEYYGTFEVEYDLYDRKGYPAKWLEKKRFSNPETEEDIYKQIKAYKRGE